MDLRLLLKTFGLVFLAELGDKTQLATLAFAADARSKWSVFLGASLALIATTAIAVLVGSALSRVVPLVWIHRVAALGFIAMGVWMLFSKA